MIEVCFVYFNAIRLCHLDAAWYSLSAQDFSDVSCVRFLDNNTQDSPEEIGAVLDRYPLPVPVCREFCKHGRIDRTHSWSVNRVVSGVPEDSIVFFTRGDYILDFDVISKFAEEFARHQEGAFVTGYAHHMAYDERGDQRVDGFRDIEPTEWRTHGTGRLLERINGWRVNTSDVDAGVWLTRRALLTTVGGFDESLTAWGYQQTVFQHRLRLAGVEIVQIPEYLFFHQHHAAPRNYDVAKQQLRDRGIDLDDLARTRPDILTSSGSVCDELDEVAEAR